MSNQTKEHILSALVWSAAIATVSALLFIIAFVLIKGVPNIKLSLFSFHYDSENVSLMPALISTIMITALSILISTPLGVFAAIYLVEYAKTGNKAVGLIRLTTETLSGVPSIVYGLFGMLFFVTFLGMGFSVRAGALTLSIMILPLIIRSAEEALLAVPQMYREGSFGLGAGKLRTIFRIVLPSAMNGILAGVILSIGRIVGETAALIYTAGTVAQIPTNLSQSARTLSVHMYALSGEGLHVEESYATAAVLMLLVIGINTLAAAIAKRIGGNNELL